MMFVSRKKQAHIPWNQYPRRNDDMFLKQRSVIGLYNGSDYHNKV